MNETTPYSEPRRLRAKILHDLHEKWLPHDGGQQEVLHSIFADGVKDIFVECGRKFGKTELVIYILVRYALLNPGSTCYYIAPFQKQAREILWVTSRLQQFFPKEFIKNVNNTEMRVTTVFDSFVKLDGSDNHEAYRGIQPHAMAYDEFKDHAPEFHVASNPNRAVFDSPLIIIGTPPEKEGPYTEILESYKTDQYKKYFNFPSANNPFISKKWLNREKEHLVANGDEEVWLREYEAKFVRGGRNSVFPMLNDDHFMDHGQMMVAIQKDAHKMRWFATADPGSTSCFAVTFAGLNEYTREWWFVDEIYEENPHETTTVKITDRIIATKIEFCPHKDWTQTYDEAAAWFGVETASLDIGESWCPTEKAQHKRDPVTREPWGISIIKDCLRMGKIHFSSRCVKLRWEMENYVRQKVKDGSTKIPKSFDHAIDTMRYKFAAAGYSLPERDEPPPEPTPIRRRTFTIEQDFAEEALFKESYYGVKIY